MGWFIKRDRIYYALHNLATILGGQVYDEFISGISKSWTLDPYALGGFALFQAGQETELQPAIVKPEGENILRWRSYNAISRMDSRCD